jgi:hypothetical protein
MAILQIVLAVWLLAITTPPLVAVGFYLANLATELAERCERRCRRNHDA